MLRAIGFQPETIRRVLLAEASMVTITAIAVGCVTGLIVSYNVIADAGSQPGADRRFAVPWLNLAVVFGTVIVASLATTLVGLQVNEARGDVARFEMYRKTKQVMDRLHELGIYTPNLSGFPLIEVPLANHEDIDLVGRYLFDRGVYVTMAAYPLVPKDEVGFRIQVTAANGDDEIELLCEVLGEINERFALQHDEHRELLHQARLARG